MKKNKRPVSSVFPSNSKSPPTEDSTQNSTGHLNDDEEKLLTEALAPNPVRDVLKPLSSVDEATCITCRGRSYRSIYQHQKSMDLKIPKLRVDAKIIRVCHLSTNNPYKSPRIDTRYELAVIDFLFPLTVTKDLHRYIPFLGFSNFVRMGDPEEGEEEQLWFARCLISSSSNQEVLVSPEVLLKEIELYKAPHFGELEWARCPNTVIGFLKRMNLSSRGYRLVRIIMPTEEHDETSYEDYSEVHLQ